MTTAQLSQYLETAVDLEKAVFLQAPAPRPVQRGDSGPGPAARRPAPAPPEAAPVAPVPKPPMEPLREILGKTLLGFLLSLAAVTGISVLTLGPARGWMTGAIGGVLLGCILAIVAYLKAVRASSFRWRTYHLLMENYQLIHGTYGCAGKSPRQSWRPGKRPTPTFCAGTRSGSPRPSAEAGPGGCPPPAHPAAGRTARPLGPPTMPKTSCSPNTGPLSWSAPCASWCSPAAAPPWKGPKVPYQQLEAELQAGWILTDWNQILRQGDRLQTRQFLLCTALQQAPAPSL